MVWQAVVSDGVPDPTARGLACRVLGDDATRFVQEQVLPQLQQINNFKGFIALGGGGSGKLLGVALWESGEVLRATEEAAARIRGGVAEATGGAATVASVENYEVSVFEVPS